MRKYTRSLAVVLSTVAVLIGILFIPITGAQAATAKKLHGTVKLGAVFPLSGPVGAIGQTAVTALHIWVNYINTHGGVGGKKLTVNVKDTASTPTTAAEDVRELAAAGIPAILGPFIVAACENGQQVADQTHTVIYCYSGGEFGKTAEDFKVSPYFFLGNLPFKQELGEMPVQFMKQKFHVKKMACIGTSTLSGQSYSSAVQQAAKAAGVQFFKATFTSGATNVTGQLDQLESDGVQAIAMCSTGSDEITTLQGIEQLGIKVPIWAPEGEAGEAPEFAKVLPEGGLFLPMPYIAFPTAMPKNYPNAADVRYFHNAYVKAEGGQLPTVVPGTTVDGLQMFIAAIEHGAKTGKQIAKYMASLKDFNKGVLSPSYTMTASTHRGNTPSNLAGQVEESGRIIVAGKVNGILKAAG